MFALPAFGQLSGNYNIGSGETYTTLKAACDDIMASGLSGNVTFLITSDLTESATSHLGINSAFSITFKPSADVDRTITFTKATDNTASSGGFVIGLSSDNWAAPVITNNITIDGYTDGGSTRRLTIATSSGAFTAHTPIHVIGDVNNLTIKNCSLTVNQTTGTAAFGPVTMRVGNWSSTDYLVDNVVIDNCVITSSTPSGAGIFVSNTTSGGGAVPTGRPTGLEFKNNIINVKHRAVSLNYAGTSSTYNNQISVNQPGSGFASFGIGGTSAGLVTTNVYNNRIIQLGTGNTAGAANGIRGIQASAGGTWNIYNNFITGFSTPASGTTELLGIRIGSGSNVYHNTIVMNNVTTTGGGTQPTSGIVAFTATADIRNNIIITEEDDFTNYAVYYSSLPTTTDYNNFHRNGTTNARIGFAVSAARATLGDLQSATSKDADSRSAAVTFVSATDLHVSGGSIGDWANLSGTLLSSPYDVDIDGHSRHTTPYMGADENLTSPLPVELTSFTAIAKGNRVELQWNTATELNNYGFDVERSIAGTWTKIGFVEGAGNSNAPRSYSFVDGSAQGAVQYRLKQIDRDGQFTYSSVVEVMVASVAERYELAQNFPNPFNPTTTIRFAVKQNEHATVKVYDITGREVATLFNGAAQAGQMYNVQFNATGLSSGIYFYVLQTPNVREVKKMSLLK
jgi:hypothetical protein